LNSSLLFFKGEGTENFGTITPKQSKGEKKKKNLFYTLGGKKNPGKSLD